MANVELHRFTVGEHTRGFAAALYADRVGISFITPDGPTWNITMTPEQARSVANALYEAAEASEKAPPVAAPTVAA